MEPTFHSSYKKLPLPQYPPISRDLASPYMPKVHKSVGIGIACAANVNKATLNYELHDPALDDF